MISRCVVLYRVVQLVLRECSAIVAGWPVCCTKLGRTTGSEGMLGHCGEVVGRCVVLSWLVQPVLMECSAIVARWLAAVLYFVESYNRF